MKKFLILPIAALLVLSGCGATEMDTQVGAGTQAQLRDGSGDGMQNGVGVPAVDIAAEAEAAITTEVAPIDDYNSTDDLMQDVDGLMDSLDSI